MPLPLPIKVTDASTIIIFTTVTATVPKLISSHLINQIRKLLVLMTGNVHFRLPRAWAYVFDYVNSCPLLQNSLIIDKPIKSEVHETSRS